MTNSSAFLGLVTAAVLAACDVNPNAGRQVSAEAITNPNANSQASANAKPNTAALPYVVGPDGTRYPYFEYKKGDSSSLMGDEDRLAVFVYPIFSSRDKGLALPYMRDQNVKELFASDELLGRQFSVVAKARTLLIDEIPVSRPIDLNADSNWVITYAGAAFDCRVASRAGVDFLIKCVSKGAQLNLRFNDLRGFTSYQDFCGKQVCTYALESVVGLLSPYHLESLQYGRAASKNR